MTLEKITDTKNGYRFIYDNDEMEHSNVREIWKNIVKEHAPVKCIIVNQNTFNNFQKPLLSGDIRVINNKLPDDVFYLNGVY